MPVTPSSPVFSAGTDEESVPGETQPDKVTSKDTTMTETSMKSKDSTDASVSTMIQTTPSTAVSSNEMQADSTASDAPLSEMTGTTETPVGVDKQTSKPFETTKESTDALPNDTESSRPEILGTTIRPEVSDSSATKLPGESQPTEDDILSTRTSDGSSAPDDLTSTITKSPLSHIEDVSATEKSTIGEESDFETSTTSTDFTSEDMVTGKTGDEDMDESISTTTTKADMDEDITPGTQSEAEEEGTTKFTAPSDEATTTKIETLDSKTTVTEATPSDTTRTTTRLPAATGVTESITGATKSKPVEETTSPEEIEATVTTDDDSFSTTADGSSSTTMSIAASTTPSPIFLTTPTFEETLEGKCAADNRIFNDGDRIYRRNDCQDICICNNSVIQCSMKACPPAPPSFMNCTPKEREGQCCPSYECGACDC